MHLLIEYVFHFFCYRNQEYNLDSIDDESDFESLFIRILSLLLPGLDDSIAGCRY